MTHICYQVKEKCWNTLDSYGEICVGCGCCSADPMARAKARLSFAEEHLQEQLNFSEWFEDPEWRKRQEECRKSWIDYFRRLIYYYRRRIKQLEAETN